MAFLFKNEQYDRSGQSSFSFENGQVQELMAEVGISQELAEYYFSPEVVPPWEEA